VAEYGRLDSGGGGAESRDKDPVFGAVVAEYVKSDSGGFSAPAPVLDTEVRGRE